MASSLETELSQDHPMPDLSPSKHSLLSTKANTRSRDEGSCNRSGDDRMVTSDLAVRTASCRNPIARTKRKRTQKSESALALLCQWIVLHQIGLSANLLLLHFMTHVCFPRARQSTRKFHLLSYHNPETGKYALGWDDFYMVLYSIIVLTGLRAATMDYVLTPLAQVAGVTKRKDRVRFAEQAWVLIYDSTLFSLGMYIMYSHEHWFNLRELWTGWPSRELEGSMKWYYLVQFAFWLQQILVVNIEERRKDHWQMLTHHVITCGLMFTSYGYHQTKVGNMILCLMDVVDLFLALAKILKYLQYQVACDIAFGVFMIVWLLTRHILYGLVIHSAYADIPKTITYGCYSGSTSSLIGPFPPPDRFAHLVDPFRDPEGVVCWNDGIKMAFVWTLLALQGILCIWFCMICKVAVKVLRGGEAEDSRSDDEEEEDLTEEEKSEYQDHMPLRAEYREPVILPPLEEEVGVEAINLERHSPTRTFRKSGGVASGVTFQSDRKELLGRIGCDKGS